MDVIPVEVLSTIFHLILPIWDSSPMPRSSRTDKSYFLKHWDEPLLNVCLVNKYWKDSVYNTPTLWTIIQVSQYTPPERVQRRLELAHNLQPDIVLKGLDDDSDTDFIWNPDSSFARSLELIKAESHRWRRLHLIENIMEEEDMKRVLPDSLPSLVEAHIGSTHLITPFEPFVSAPALERLTTHAECCPPFYFLDSGALKHLRIVDLNDFGWKNELETFFPFLAASCPLLETIELDNLTRPPTEDGAYEPNLGAQLSFPNLRELLINETCYPSFAYLIRRLSAPKLEVLDVRSQAIPNIDAGTMEKLKLPSCRLRLHLKPSDIAKLLPKVANPEEPEFEVSPLRGR